MATQLQKLMFTMDLMDRVTGPAGKIQQTLGNVADKAQESFSKIAVGGAGVAAAGVALYSMAAPAHEFNMAIGQVRSLDVAQDSLDKLSNKAIEFSMKYGESANDFIKSSYDIQSAISGLTGDELSSFTNASNILAKGTKADASTITDYMGTMYGIFKDSANTMGKAEWVERLTGQTATAVQMFKTDGNKMAASFSALGSSATAMGISLSEQMGVMGTLQATMSGSESATKYNAFIGGAVGAQEKLGLSFFDSAGKMKSMTTILDSIQGKIGHLGGDKQFAILKNAFGSEEAVKLIQDLIPKTDELKGSITELNNVAGMDKAKVMAESMVDPFQKWSHSIKAVSIGFGQALLPSILPVVEGMTKGAGVIYNWTKEFPTLTKWVGYGGVAVVGITGAVAAFAVMGGIASMSTFGYANATKFATKINQLFTKESILAKWAMVGWNFATKLATGGITILKWGLSSARTGFLSLNLATIANSAVIKLNRWAMTGWSFASKLATGGMGLLKSGLIATKTGFLSLNLATITNSAVMKLNSWAMGGWSLATKLAAGGMGILQGGLLATRTGFLWLNAAMLANPVGFIIGGVMALTAGVAAIIYYWDDLKTTFKDVGWIQSIMGWIEKIGAGFQAFGQYISDTISWTGQILTGWIDEIIGGFKAFGQCLWDLGSKIFDIGSKVFLFATPLGWVVLLIKKLVGSWDSLKATFMDSSWGQAIMGWLDKILGSFNLLSKGWDWVSDKLSWVPGFGKDSEDVPKSSPSLDAPKKMTVQPGGAAKSISNAVTNNSRADSRTTHIGQIVSSKPINSPEITNMLYGAGA